MRQDNEIESVFLRGHCHLEVICGPMFSGKTEELIRLIRRVEYARLKSIVFKPMIDIRFSKDLVVSHAKQTIQSIPVESVARIRSFLANAKDTYHVIGLDEAQFFDDDVVELCEDLVASGHRVIAAGLCEDYLGKPFGPMPALLAHADSVTKLWAICMKCGAPASKTQRIVKSEGPLNHHQVLVGAEKLYEARCRACHKKNVLTDFSCADEPTPARESFNCMG